MPPITHPRYLELEGRTVKSSIGDGEGNPNRFIVQGVGASPGFTRGRALVVRPGQGRPPSIPNESIIVVARVPDRALVIEWRDIASGFVFEMGSKICHAALICLELGRPCVVGAFGLIERLGGSPILEIDGDVGRIEVLDEDM